MLSDNTAPDFVIENDILIEYNGKGSNVVIPDNVKSIDNWVFSECTSLKSIVIPDSVTSIGVGAFGDCRSLINIEIPSSVTSIGNYAFDNCSKLKSITYKGTKEEALNILKVNNKWWRKYSSIEKIICTDGDIELDSED